VAGLERRICVIKKRGNMYQAGNGTSAILMTLHFLSNDIFFFR